MSVPDGRRRLEEEILAIDQELRELGHREGRNCPFCKRHVPEGSLAACARGGGVFGMSLIHI